MSKASPLACLALALALMSPAVGQEPARQAAELDRAIDYLQRRKAQDPVAADADVKACAFAGRDAGAVVDCMMGREREQDAQKRKPAFPAALVPSKPPKGEQAPAVRVEPERREHITQIVFGGKVLKIVEGNPRDILSSISYDGSLIRDFPSEYLSINSVNFLDFGNEIVLIYYANLGGSGTPNGYGLISIGEKGNIYATNLPVGSGKFVQTVTRDSIAFDLGLSEGKEVRAAYAGGRLTVTRTAAPKNGLNSEDCSFLYNDVISACSTPDRSVCRYDGIMLSMALQRSINTLASDDPNFRQQDFEAACEQVCRTKRKPPFAAFRKAVCLPR